MVNVVKNKGKLQSDNLFVEVIRKLDIFFQKRNCAVIQPYSIMPVGAATFHPATVLYTLIEPVWNICWAQECSRPDDSRDGRHRNRRQRFYQYQVIMKPAPEDTIDMIKDCLRFVGLDVDNNDIKFVKDDWKSPTLGATGIGWEVWCNGTEICQLTYMQQLASRPCNPIALEITFGVERLVTHIQKVEHFDQIKYVHDDHNNRIFNKILQIEEQQFAQYNTSLHNVEQLKKRFDECSKECQELLALGLCLPAYKFTCEACDIFNLLCSKGVLSVMQKEEYTQKVRALVKVVCDKWIELNNQLNSEENSKVSNLENKN